MSERKYVVPEGMIKAGKAVLNDPSGPEVRSHEQWAEAILEAGLRWLISQNPDVGESPEVGIWLRRMFLAPEPEVPSLEDVIECLLANLRCGGPSLDVVDAKMEAYRRGQKAGAK